MFLDLVASTPLLHDMGGAAFSEMMSGLQTDMARVVTRSGGEFERTTGDGFIAVFTSQGPPHHAVQALESIAKLEQAVGVAGQKVGRELKINIGVETGMVTGAYVREGNNHMWSSAGRTVVMAQRLQSLCQKLGVEVAVGPVTQKLCEEKFEFRLAGTEVPKGFPDEVQIFTIMTSALRQQV
jgi:class 3 adenylate cyclase